MKIYELSNSASELIGFCYQKITIRQNRRGMPDIQSKTKKPLNFEIIKVSLCYIILNHNPVLFYTNSIKVFGPNNQKYAQKM